MELLWLQIHASALRALTFALDILVSINSVYLGIYSAVMTSLSKTITPFSASEGHN